MNMIKSALANMQSRLGIEFDNFESILSDVRRELVGTVPLENEIRPVTIARGIDVSPVMSSPCLFDAMSKVEHPHHATKESYFTIRIQKAYNQPHTYAVGGLCTVDTTTREVIRLAVFQMDKREDLREWYKGMSLTQHHWLVNHWANEICQLLDLHQPFEQPEATEKQGDGITVKIGEAA